MIQILVDNPSWIWPYAEDLRDQLCENGYECYLVNNVLDLKKAKVTFFLGCINIVSSEYLRLSQKNLVVHESALPKRRGFAPFFWAILAGENEITFSLIEALSNVDSGSIYAQKTLQLKGNELNFELRRMQGKMTLEICKEYINGQQNQIPKPQIGKATYCEKRTPADSELDPKKTIEEQFNLLRVVNNDEYPAFFHLKNRKYVLKIEVADE